MTVSDTLALLDWKRRVFSLYAAVRALEPAAGWALWRGTRDELFRSHPQSPHPGYTDLTYFPYDPAARVLADLEDIEELPQQVAPSGTEAMLFRPFARAHFQLTGEALSLEVYWLEGYGGGIFLPLRDATSGLETYGGGRYVLDTVKGADLGEDGGGSCSTSTSPTTRPAPTTRAGSARWPRPRT